MEILRAEIFKKVIIIISILFFISCENHEIDFETSNKFFENPLGIASDVKLIYTDSTKIQAVLTAPIHLDYNHLSFKYSEFPKGLKVTFYDDNGKENKIYADYGIFYKSTKIVDLKKNVKLISNDGSELFTQQLFWDAENEWLFTEEQFTFKNMDYDIDAVRLDTNKEFSEFKTGKLSGLLNFTEIKDSLNNEKL